jgi:hypothetical protein
MSEKSLQFPTIDWTHFGQRKRVELHHPHQSVFKGAQLDFNLAFQRKADPIAFRPENVDCHSLHHFTQVRDTGMKTFQEIRLQPWISQNTGLEDYDKSISVEYCWVIVSAVPAG